MMRYVRSAVLDVIRLDYVTTARSKGLNERTVITKHVVRSALIAAALHMQTRAVEEPMPVAAALKRSPPM